MYLVLDDHPIARKGLAEILHSYSPEEEVLEAGTVQEAVSCMGRGNTVDIAFIDVNLGKESGFDFFTWLKKKHGEVRTIFISSSSQESDFLHARRMGVDAYILKDAFIDEIMFGLHTVKRGGKFYSAALMEKMDSCSELEDKLHRLTKRELEVLKLIGRGYSNAEISSALYITMGTVKKHVSSVLEKLELRNRVDAVLLVGSCGELSEPDLPCV